MPPTVPPHLLQPDVPRRVLILPGFGAWQQWLQWRAELKDTDLVLRCPNVWAVAERRAQAIAVFLALGLVAVVCAIVRARMRPWLAALLIVLDVVVACGLGVLLCRRAARVAYDAATDSAAAEAAEFLPDVLLGHSVGALVALRLRDRCISVTLVAPPPEWLCMALGLEAPHGIDAVAGALVGPKTRRAPGQNTPELLYAARVPGNVVEMPRSSKELRFLLGGRSRLGSGDSDGMMTASSRGQSAYDEALSALSA